MDQIVIEGRIFIDDRGKLVAFNDFSLDRIKRMYQIEHPSKGMMRAWQGHKIENKWFYVIYGSFAIAYVLINDFENPSKNNKASFKTIKADDQVILNIPAGYANGLKSLESDSRIIIFSDLTLEEAKNDNFRFDSKLWLNWDFIN